MIQGTMGASRTGMIAAATALLVLAAGCQSTGQSQVASAPPAPSLNVAFADAAWTGDAIPDGQHCTKFGGKGATPALSVSGLPSGTTKVIVEFNDLSYSPLSRNGGHGKIGHAHGGGSEATLVSVPGETDELPEGIWVESKNRATGSYARPGYLPPCSGGRGNTYAAVVKAVDASGATVASGKITLGRY